MSFAVASNADPAQRNGDVAINDERVEITQQGRPCEFRLSSTREQVDPSGGDRTIDVRPTSAMCEWTARAEAPWLSVVAGSRGTGNGTVTIHVEPVSGSPRSGTVTVAGQRVEVEQGIAPVVCSLTVSPSAVSLPAAGGSAAVALQVAAGCTWTAESSVSWITIGSTPAGSGPAELRFSVAPWSGPPRAGTIRVGDRTVTVTQASGCSGSIDPPSLTVPASGGTSTVRVASAAGCAWSASTSAPWITVAAASGTGSGEVRLAIAANTSPARQATVAIGGLTLNVSQASGCTYDVSPRRIDIGGGGGASGVSVATGAGCPWTAATTTDWMSLAPSNAAGPGQVQLSAAPNTGPPRAGAVTVAGIPVAIAQASPCTFLLLPPYMIHDAGGGNGAVLVIVTGGCTWSAASTVDWITMTSGTSGRGDGVVQFTVAPNPGPARSGVVVIAGQHYNVTQGGR